MVEINSGTPSVARDMCEFVNGTNALFSKYLIVIVLNNLKNKIPKLFLTDFYKNKKKYIYTELIENG